MAYEYFFMFGAQMLSQSTAALVAKEWRLDPTDHLCDACEKPLISKRTCPDNDGPHPWRLHFMAMGNPTGETGDIAKQVAVGETMGLVPIPLPVENPR